MLILEAAVAALAVEVEFHLVAKLFRHEEQFREMRRAFASDRGSDVLVEEVPLAAVLALDGEFLHKPRCVLAEHRADGHGQEGLEVNDLHARRLDFRPLSSITDLTPAAIDSCCDSAGRSTACCAAASRSGARWARLTSSAAYACGSSWPSSMQMISGLSRGPK